MNSRPSPVHATGRVRHALLALLCTLAVTVVGLVAPVAPRAAAADLSQFNPGHIITDQNFWDSTVMTAAEVQAFLDAKGAACRVGADGSPCLKNFRTDTTSRPATSWCPGAYAGRPGETAAQIITKVAVACGVSPRVLLVLLQKEQSLVRTTNPTATQYRSATGFRCPDFQPCDPRYAGFFNQVYEAASRFRQYAATPASFGHQAGEVEQIAYHPNPACGSAPVRIHNQATANLYNYTPFQPNAAALAAGYGTGDACSAYGNRNFYNYFYDWFGDPTGVPPIGVIDAISTTNTGLTAHGWALDPDTTAPISVHVYVDGVAVSARADLPRPDVAQVYGKGDRHGYSVTVPQTPGPHAVCVHAINADPGRNTLLGCRDVVVPDRAPLGAVDAITTTGTSITVSGWSLDPDTSAPNDVHVYIDGVGVALRADLPRPDIAQVFGKGELHGFTHTRTVQPGRHDVCVYGIGTVVGGANTLLTCRTVVAELSTARPFGVIDSVTTTPQGLTVSGWTIDPDTTEPTDVHVYVDGVGVAVRADASRPDVAAAYGRGDRHGYTHSRLLSPGKHSVCVHAINTGPGQHALLGCRDVTVPTNATPIGSVDAIIPTPTGVSISGWVLDPDTVEPTEAHIYIDGVGAAVRADLSRPDVAAAYGRGDRHGFTHSRLLSRGTHEACVYAIDTTGTGHRLLTCQPFTVTG